MTDIRPQTEEEQMWDQFVRLRAWRYFDPDRDNPGGADDISAQAASVVQWMSTRLLDAIREHEAPPAPVLRFPTPQTPQRT